jgi:mRNA-degrading endonuclease toxin of MazEF toxin-antitoxin module
VNPGDVVAVMFPFSATQAEPYKRRPVLVVNEIGSPPDQAILCVMITSSERRLRSPRAGDVVISDYQGAGLARPSVIRCRRVWTAESTDVHKHYGAVDAATLAQVRSELAVLLGLPSP